MKRSEQTTGRGQNDTTSTGGGSGNWQDEREIVGEIDRRGGRR